MATKKRELQSFIRSLPVLAGVLGKKLGVKIQIGGSSAYTDGKTIYLPSLPLDGGEELFVLANGFVDHEAAHVRMTDFDELQKSALIPLTHYLFNMVEDMRVERELVKMYPGCREHFQKLYAEVIKKASPEKSSEAAHNITSWLLSVVCQEQYPDVEFPVQVFREAVDEQFPNLVTQLEPFIQPGLICSSTAESIAWAKSVEEFLQQYFSRSKPKQDAQEQDSPQGDPGTESSGDGGEPFPPYGGDDSDTQNSDDSDAGSALQGQDGVQETEPGEPQSSSAEDTPDSDSSEYGGQQKSGDVQGNADDQGEKPSDSASPDADSDSVNLDDSTSPAGERQPSDGYADEQPGRNSSSNGNASGDGNSDDCPTAESGDSVTMTEPEKSEGHDGFAGDVEEADALQIPQQGEESGPAPDFSAIAMLDRIIQGDGGQDLAGDARESLRAMVNSEGEIPPSFGELLRQILEQVSAESRAEDCLQVAVAKGELPDEMPRPLIEDAQSATKVLATRLSGLLQTQTLGRIHTGRRGRVDGNRLHRLAAENPRVFKQAAEKQSINTAVHILLDRSYSMNSCMSLANAACYSVASALHRIRGVNVGVTSFPGEWEPDEQCTVFPILKHGQRMHTRFAARAYGGTPMGEALWWTCKQMMSVKENRKIILLITDGYPDSFRNAEAALETARNMGFDIIGIGIGEHGAFICNLVENSRVINDIQELAPAMFGVLQQALTERG